MKIDFDTKLFKVENIIKHNPEEILRKVITLDTKQEQMLLKSIYFNNCFVPVMYYIINESENDKHYFLKNSFIFTVLNKFLNDEIRISFIDGNNDIKNPLFSELKSSDKRIFTNYDIYTRLIICKNSKEMTETILNSDLL